MKKRRLSGILLTAVMLLSCLAAVPAQKAEAAAAAYEIPQKVVTKPEVEKEDAAYILFSENEKMSGMSYIKPNGAGRYDELYSESATFNGITGRQVYVENYLYFNIDKDFADENDRVFSLTFDYWDYGGGGYFYVEYIPNDELEYKRIAVPKLGLDENNNKTAGTWFSATIYIDDANFTGRADHGADFRIVSGAYNTFALVSVRNLSRNAGAEEEFGPFNMQKANSLYELGMFEGFEGDTAEDGSFNPDMLRELTREQALVQMIKSYNLTDEALSKNYTTTFSDVSTEAKPYIGLAQQLGILERGSKLGANETFTQEELVTWYLKLYGLKEEDFAGDVYAKARELGLISGSSMIFQKDKKVNTDAFVTLAVNIFAMNNQRDGYNPFTSLFEQGVYNEETINRVNDENITNWLLSNEFNLQYIEHVDEISGRSYRSLSYLGSGAIKDYYTQNCMSMDMKKLYFRTENLQLFEYDMATQKCRYIGDLMREWNQMVTPLNNLWYLNKKGQIMKVDLDTYEQTVAAELPEWQKRRAPTMLQVNNDESKLSFQWSDASGEIDPNKEARIPVLDLKTGEWDLSHKWGFPTEWYVPDHQCINPNPDYSNYVFFAHEGYSKDEKYGTQRQDGQTSQYDRIWVVNTDTDEYYNVYPQKYYISPDPDIPGSGLTGEGCVHEAWSNDGEWLIAVKDPNMRDNIRREIREAGAIMVRPDGSDKKYIPGDWTFTHDNGFFGSRLLHCMLSNDDRWLVSDTTYSSSLGFSDLYLIDTYTGKSYFLARLSETGNDPGHVHPQFSPDDQMVIFGLWSDDQTHAQIGWMDVSDIIASAPDGGEYQLSESCRTFGYENCSHYIIPQYDDEGSISSFKIPAGNLLYVDVNKTVTEADNTPATISITYKDDSTQPIKFSYYTWNDNHRTNYNTLAEHVQYIQRKNTGQILTRTFTFDDICLGNMELFGSDFTLSAIGADAEIISVDVTVTEGKE